MPRTLHLDFETASEINIKTAGIYKYAMHPSTRVLMAGYALDHHAPDLWVPAEGEEMPRTLFDALVDPDIEVHAFNAKFERLILWHVLQIRVPIERFRCTMVHAWSLSFSGSLGAVGAQMGLPLDKAKDARGKKLIDKFCKPAPKNHKADWYGPDNAPADWAAFKAYCIQDVIAEREIEMLLAAYPMPPQELDHWFWDQDVNDRGVPVDTDLVSAAVHLERKEKARLRHEMNRVTCLENANSPQQLAQWLSARGESLPDLQKETVKRAIKETQDLVVRDVLRMRAQVSKTSTKKWEAFQNATCDDGLLRGMFEFGGAQRTQRWAGRVVQLQNLKSPGPEFESIISEVVDVFLCEDPEVVRTLYGDVLDLLSQGVRCAITAPDGYVLGPCDLSSIESRVLGYLSGCDRINRIFAEGKDTYKDFAMELFGCRYEDVTKAQRKYAKPPTLGCGYQLGGPGLIEYAAGMGVDMDGETAQRAVDLYRYVYPEVPAMWYWLVDSCKDVVQNWTEHTGYGVHIHRDQNFLMIDLPSGRRIYYYQPLVLPMVPPWERDKPPEEQRRRPTLTYMGMNQHSKKWERLTTHGGKITENCLAAGTLVLTHRGWVRIESVGAGDLVHDGVEFVRHGGVVFKSVQPCVRVDGVYMTADHEVLTDEGWKAASTDPRPYRPDLRGVDDAEPGAQRREEEILAFPLRLRAPVREDRRRRAEGNEARRNSELRVYDRPAHREEEHHSRDDEASGLRGVAFDASEMHAENTPSVEGLRGPGHRRVPEVGGLFRAVLGGHGADVREGSGSGPRGQQRPVFPGELQVGTPETEHHEPANLGSGGGRARAGKRDRYSEVDALLPGEARVAARGDHQGPGPRKPVYDILNCGLRHRFVVRGEQGPFIVHNCVQAFARDVLVFHMRETEERFGPIICGHVHDELIPLLPADRAEEMLAEIERIMSIPPPWAPALLLGAKGFLTKRYRKD